MTDYQPAPDWGDIRRMAEETIEMSQKMDEQISALLAPLANAVKLMCAYVEVHEEAIRRLIHSIQTGGRLATLDEMERAQRLREMLEELPDPIRTTMTNVGCEIGIVPMTMEEIIAADPGPEEGKPSVGADDVLPGPYRSDDQGRPWRLESMHPERYRQVPGSKIKPITPAHVVITDPLGHNERTITEEEWHSMPLDFTPAHIIGET